MEGGDAFWPLRHGQDYVGQGSGYGMQIDFLRRLCVHVGFKMER